MPDSPSEPTAPYSVDLTYNGVVHLKLSGVGQHPVAELLTQMVVDPLIVGHTVEPRPILVLDINSCGYDAFIGGALFTFFDVVARETPCMRNPTCSVIASKRADYPHRGQIADLATCLKSEGQSDEVIGRVLREAKHRWNAAWRG